MKKGIDSIISQESIRLFCEIILFGDGNLEKVDDVMFDNIQIDK